MARRLTEDRLLAAAGDLLVEVGPHGATVREIARRAGVNHGLVHHYFGSKEGLLRAAMIALLEDHRAFVKQASDGGPLPRPMGLLDQQRYLRAIAHCVLDG
ncbi:MAG: TetR family transcriptional regulator, partial [Acidimicrobiia bacterium]|nr:TetR family transcriptional regulator [Acidimicrobiia bacterium]